VPCAPVEVLLTKHSGAVSSGACALLRQATYLAWMQRAARVPPSGLHTVNTAKAWHMLILAHAAYLASFMSSS